MTLDAAIPHATTTTRRRPGPPGDGLSARVHDLATSVATAIPTLLFLYVMLIWPLAFPDPPDTPAQQALGWLVEAPAKAPSPLKQIAYPALFLLAGACLLAAGAYRRIPWRNFGVATLFVTIVYFAATSLWSLAPAQTLVRAALLAMIVMTLLFSIFTARSVAPMLTGIFWVMFAAAVANTAALAVLDPTPIGHAGIYNQKNVFGWAAAFILYFGMFHVLSGGLLQRLAAAFMIAMAPVFLIASESKTSVGMSVLAPLLATALWFAARRLRLSPAFIFTVMVASLAFIFFLGRAAGAWDFMAVSEAVFGNATLTGRTDIWAFTLGLIHDRPILGYGYEAVFSMGSDGIVARNAVGFVRAMPTAHNGYLDIWVQTGFVGLVLLVALIAAVLDEAGRVSLSNSRFGWLALTLLSFILFHNFLESDLLISSNPVFMMFLFLFFAALRIRER